MITTREALLRDVEALSEGLREADRLEVTAVGRTPEDALTDGITLSRWCHTIVKSDDTPVGILGVSDHPVSEDVGVVWMLATDDIKEEPIRFLRQCSRYAEILFEVGNYKQLTNWTDARNTLHHKWIKWCGGVFTDRRPIGENGEHFLEFVIERK